MVTLDKIDLMQYLVKKKERKGSTICYAIYHEEKDRKVIKAYKKVIFLVSHTGKKNELKL